MSITLSNNVIIKLNIRKAVSFFVRSFYDARTKNDTIFAPLTTINPNKGSPLSVIRVSGNKTEQIIKKLTNNLVISRNTRDNPKRTVKTLEPRKACLAKLFNFLNQDLIDIGLILWFPNPKSYTGEDSCEFHLHGSQSIQATIMKLLGTIEGVRPAEPGEFTRRAVNNGKMSLIEAEGLNDLIASKSDNQRKLALKGLTGSTRYKYDKWIQDLIGILAHLEASIDFGEDELVGEKNVLTNCMKRLSDLKIEISGYVDSNSHTRNYILSGARLAILGKPNAGKSTLMNILCKKEKSIVSDMSGTTRDVIEHSFDIGGHAVTLCDTAGLKALDIRKKKSIKKLTQDLLEKHELIEKEGIERALDTASQADIIIYLIDGTKLVDNNKEAIIKSVTNELDDVMSMMTNQVKNIHIIINKIDLNRKLKDNLNCDSLREVLETQTSHKCKLTVSLLSCKSTENLELCVEHLICSLDQLMSKKEGMQGRIEQFGEKLDFDYVNERHLALLNSTCYHLEHAIELKITSIDQIAQHVRESLDYLSRIVGSVSEERVYDVIFRDFCIGK